MLINWVAFIDPLCCQMYDVSVCNKSVLTMIMTQSFFYFLLFWVIYATGILILEREQRIWKQFGYLKEMLQSHDLCMSK